LATAAVADAVVGQKQAKLNVPVRARLLDGLLVKHPADADQGVLSDTLNTIHDRVVTADGRLFASTTEVLILPHSTANGKPNRPDSPVSLPASQPITAAPTEIARGALNGPSSGNRTGKISLSANRPGKSALSRPAPDPGNEHVSINNPGQEAKDEQESQGAGLDAMQEHAAESGVSDGSFPEIGVFFGQSGSTDSTAPARPLSDWPTGQKLPFPWHVNTSGIFAQNRLTPAQSASHKGLNKIAPPLPNQGEDKKLQVSNHTLKDGFAEQTPSPPVPRNYSFVESIFALQQQANTSRVMPAKNPIIQAISDVLHRMLANTTASHAWKHNGPWQDPTTSDTTGPGKTRQHQAQWTLGRPDNIREDPTTSHAIVPTRPNNTNHVAQERRRLAREYHRQTQFRRASVAPRAV